MKSLYRNQYARERQINNENVKEHGQGIAHKMLVDRMAELWAIHHEREILLMWNRGDQFYIETERKTRTAFNAIWSLYSK